ncbi:MAG: hypothetical protein P4L50_04025 [Anaerolineaceae bacterium]|nr:hypothetical protein [Anaerolineaceae bacterium]
MTPQQFLGLDTLFERGGNAGELDNLEEATGRQLWMDARLDKAGGHAPYCGVGQATCLNGIFNFLGAYAGNYPAGRFSGDEKQVPVFTGDEDTSNIMSEADNVGAKILTANLWSDFTRDRPYGWGNQPAPANWDNVKGGYGYNDVIDHISAKNPKNDFWLFSMRQIHLFPPIN